MDGRPIRNIKVTLSGFSGTVWRITRTLFLFLSLFFRSEVQSFLSPTVVHIYNRSYIPFNASKIC